MSTRAQGRLADDSCDRDVIWDREVETEPHDQAFARAAAAWQKQFLHLTEHSSFYARKFREAGITARELPLKDITRLPFSTKQELKQAMDESPPFGSNLCVPPDRVKRVYQTSGTTGAPSVLALTKADMEAWTVIGTRTYFATGIHDHSSVLTTFGAGPFVAGHTHFVLSRIGCRSVPVAPGDTDRVIFGLKAGLADTLLSTPSFAQYLANRMEKVEAEQRFTELTHVVTGGEPGGGIPAIRDHIQTVLGVTVTEVMGIGDIAPSLFGECPQQQGMHFCGGGHVWVELIDPKSREPITIEPGAAGELVYTHLTREAMPVVRFLGGDVARIEGSTCECGRATFRMRVIGRRDDMFIVRGVNAYPSAVLAVVGTFRPRVTGRARVIRKTADTSIPPPVPIEVEVPDGHGADQSLAEEIETAIRARLIFRAKVALIPEQEFGESGYKTRLTVERP
jgi:phenylacetate-CoA ligase